jgi:DNA-binding response OmpR family regulator
MSLIKQFLNKNSFAAEYVYRTEGTKVIEKIKEYKPDLVILESSTGPEGQLCQRIKDSTTANIPVILMTGNVLTDKPHENCGADDIIPKPFEPKVLLEKIETLLKTG